jgi:hypothetical protein
MNRNTYLALLAAVAIPFAAIAQEQTQDPATPAEKPLIEEGVSQDQAAEETAPADEATEETAKSDEMTDDAMTDTAMAGENAVDGPFVTVPQTGAWRVTDLEGKTVADANGENIGDINDVLVNEKGEVIAVLVGVGGFLGIGEKDVAVSMSALEFGPGKTEGLKTQAEKDQELQAQAEAQTQLPAGGATGTTGLGGGATTNTTASIEPPVEEDPVVGDDNLPDRIVLNVTREQLEAAPAYEDIEAGIDATATSEVPVEPEPEPSE